MKEQDLLLLRNRVTNIIIKHSGTMTQECLNETYDVWVHIERMLTEEEDKE